MTSLSWVSISRNGQSIMPVINQQVRIRCSVRRNDNVSSIPTIEIFHAKYVGTPGKEFADIVGDLKGKKIKILGWSAIPSQTKAIPLADGKLRTKEGLLLKPMSPDEYKAKLALSKGNIVVPEEKEIKESKKD